MNLAPNCPIDLDTLLQTRALIVAGSGGGKSYALRKLIEETAGKVQQLVIDPEGEFASLRERHDFVLVAPRDGDVVASPKTAALLARRLLELGASAILDIYDLRADERQRFVKLFLDALVNAPRELWHPVMVVLDEAHIFCPQNGSAEAMQAVIDVATRGRKRGQCLVLATQRLSKLHKDTAAEMFNKLIGLTQLDVDRKRAADELGMTAKETATELRQLDRGEFFAFGPALTRDVAKIRVGKVQTTHASGSGKLMRTPPAPSAKIKTQLAKLADLPKEAEVEARTIDELKAEIARLKREAKKPAIDEATIDAAVQRAIAAEQRKMKATLDEMRNQISVAYRHANAITDALIVSPTFTKSPASKVKPAHISSGALTELQPGEVVELRSNSASALSAPNLRSGAMKILSELAARSPAGYSRAQVGALTKFSHKGGTFNTYLSDLRRAGFIEERDGLVFASDAGIAQFGDKPPAPATHEEVMAQWAKALRSGAFKMLQAVVSAGSEGLHRANLADLVNMTAAGGTFNTYLSDLRRNGLIEERGKRLFANDILFP